MRVLSLSLMSAVAFAAPLGALSAKEASGSTVITARVPAVCEIATDTFVAAQDGKVTGSVFEYCNSSTSYQIIASHRPLDVAEFAEVRYGRERTSLRNSGQTTVAVRFGQRLERVAVEIETQDLSEPLAVAFSISAI